MRKIPKLCRPEVTGVSIRPRVHQELRKSSAAPLSWVASPAGSGKTCAVAAYVSESRRPVAWLHLDSDDAEPATFFHYLSRATAQTSLPVLRPEYRSGIGTFARGYFRELFTRLREGTLLVLDNYEALPASSEVHELLAAAVFETPPGIAWIILSRTEPPPALARARADGKLRYVGWEILRFTLEESRQLVELLRGRDLAMTPWVETLHAWTQGWAAGIVLSPPAVLNEQASVMQPMQPMQPDVIFEYFASEIFRELTEAERTFLIETACLPELSPSHAEKLTRNSRAEQILNRLARQNYFTFRLASSIGSRSKHQVYRYHPLFRRFLLEQAEQRLDSTRLLELRTCAARILSDQGHVEEAVVLLRKLGNWVALVELLRRHVPELIEQGRHEVLASWLEDLPEELEDEQRAWLSYWKATAHLPFDPSAAQRLYERAFEAFSRERHAEGVFLSWSGATEALLYGWGSFRDLDRWIDELNRLMREFKPPTLAIEARLSAIMHSALTFRRPADPDILAWDKRVRGFVYLSRLLDVNHYVLLAINLFYYDLWSGRITKARAMLDSLDGALSSKRIGPVARLAGYTMRAVFGHFTGDGKSSVEASEAGLELARESGVHFWDFLLLAQAAFGAIVLGDVPLASKSLDQMRRLLHPERHLENLLYYDAAAQTALAGREFAAAREYSAQAVDFAVRLGALFPEAILRVGASQTLFACGSVQEAVAELDRAQALAEKVASTVLLARCYLARALYLSQAEPRPEADQALARGLALCREQGYFGLPWWQSDAMAELCQRALQAGIETEFVRDLIARRELVPPAGAELSSTWPWHTMVYTLGPEFVVLVRGKPIRFNGKAQRRPLELLQALLAFGGTQVGEMRLAEALWPDSDGDAGLQAVATTLHRLRKLIDPAVILRSDQRLTLNRALCWVDCFACETSWATRDVESQAFQDALTEYRGGFLSDCDAPWALGYRLRLAAKFVRAIEARVAVLLARSRWPEAASLYEHAIDIEPANESLYRGLMALLREHGQSARAADVYRRCCESMRLYHDSSPSSETTHLARSRRA